VKSPDVVTVALVCVPVQSNVGTLQMTTPEPPRPAPAAAPPFLPPPPPPVLAVPGIESP